jgi:hypothetical protein
MACGDPPETCCFPHYVDKTWIGPRNRFRARWRGDSPMEQSELLRFVGETFDRLGIKYFITGSQATIVYGEPRFTNDIDVVASLSRANLDEFVKSFPSADFYLSVTAAREAIDRAGTFSILHPTSGLKVDVIIPGTTPYEVGRFGRARTIQVAPDFAARFASPEDVIIKKLEFFKVGGSDKHLRDIAGVLRISGSNVNRTFIGRVATHFGVADVWEAALARAES